MKQRSSLVPVVVISMVLLVLHQDYWLWTNPTLVFGFLPIGLFWHLCISLAAVLGWAVVTHFYWPFDSEHFASNIDDKSSLEADPQETNKESHR